MAHSSDGSDTLNIQLMLIRSHKLMTEVTESQRGYGGMVLRWMQKIVVCSERAYRFGELKGNRVSKVCQENNHSLVCM